MTNTRPGRPRGSRNTKPSKAAVAGYYRLLAGAADQGDTAAAGALVVADAITRKPDEEPSELLRMAAPVAAYVPREMWHCFPDEVQDAADALARRISEVQP